VWWEGKNAKAALAYHANAAFLKSFCCYRRSGTNAIDLIWLVGQLLPEMYC
jgi:hypothetical protein